MNNKAFDSLCSIVSYHHFTIIYSVISITLIILRLLSVYIPQLDFLKIYLLLALHITLIFSIVVLIYQTQGVDIVIYPPKFQISDYGKFYGISDVSADEERNIEVLFLKKGHSKITINYIKVQYPEYGTLDLLKTSFLNDNTYTIISETEVPNNENVSVDKSIQGLSANVYRYRVYNKNYYKMTSNDFIVTLSYTIHLFFVDLNIKKQTIAKSGY